MLTQREDLLYFALQLARAAAEQIMPHYHNCVVSTKPDGTEVTEADEQRASGLEVKERNW